MQASNCSGGYTQLVLKDEAELISIQGCSGHCAVRTEVIHLPLDVTQRIIRLSSRQLLVISDSGSNSFDDEISVDLVGHYISLTLAE